MSSSYSYSDSATYTVVDVRKVMDQIHSDLRSIAQMTGYWTQSYADDVMADIIAFAENEYLDEVDIRLIGSDGKNVRVYNYDVLRNVGGLTGARVGGNLWAGSAKRMSVTLTYSSTWHNLDEAKKAAFKEKRKIGWSPTTDDLSVAHLATSGERIYSSNGYAVQKKVYG